MPRPKRIRKVAALLENEDELLSLAVFCKHSNRTPSVCLEIADDLTAFEFDATCAFLYQEFENKREAKRLEAQLRGIAVILGADPEKMRDEDDDTAEELVL